MTNTHLLKAPVAAVDLKRPTAFKDMLGRLLIDFRWNVRALRREWNLTGPPTGQPDGWQHGDNFEAWLITYLDQLGETFTDGLKDDGSPKHVTLKRTANFDEIARAVSHLYQRDPLLDWLHPLTEWDATPRIDGLLDNLFGLAEGVDPELAAWASRYPFIGVVERARNPGAKIDEIPVLVSGSQGIGKSTMLAHLLPPDLGLFGELSLELDEQRRFERLRGKALMEITEMTGSTKRGATEENKAWMSRIQDEWTLKYDKLNTVLPRRFVMVGTTNRADSLPDDPSGNRRFVPIDLAGAKYNLDGLIARVTANREQMWAEARHGHDVDGLRTFLPESLKPVAWTAATDHTFTSSESLDAAVANLYSESPMTMIEIKSELSNSGVETLPRSDTVIGRSLTKAGWKRTRKAVNGTRRSLWSPPPGMRDSLFE